eukprot:13401181-Alexandrium_andersonii.AAC.1
MRGRAVGLEARARQAPMRFSSTLEAGLRERSRPIALARASTAARPHAARAPIEQLLAPTAPLVAHCVAGRAELAAENHSGHAGGLVRRARSSRTLWRGSTSAVPARGNHVDRELREIAP